LRWNDFEQNTSNALREVREEGEFFDCTLSTGEKQLPAHKLILAACSPFFRGILRQNPHTNPLLYLKGVDHANLQSILQFLYHGEVNIAQTDLSAFLAVAEDLQIRGLTQKDKEHVDQEVRKPVEKARQISVGDSVKPSVRQSYPEMIDIEEMPVKTEQPSETSVPVEPVVYNEEVEEMYEDYSEFPIQESEGGPGLVAAEIPSKGFPSELDDTINSMIAYQDGNYVCIVCHKGFKSMLQNARAHVEAKHTDSAGVACQVCGFVSKTRDSLRKHTALKHKKPC